MAARMTKRAAGVEDWRLATKADRGLKVLALELAKSKGYIIATPQEIAERYSTLVPKWFVGAVTNTNKMIWGVNASVTRRNGRVSLSFAAV